MLGAAFAPEIAPIPLTFSGAGYYELAQIGLAQAGALRCEWSDGGSPERYLTMSVLPAATDAWATQSAAIATSRPGDLRPERAPTSRRPTSSRRPSEQRSNSRLRCNPSRITPGSWSPAARTATGATTSGRRVR
ncbi:MAG: hypothetical protein WBL06_12575 [Pseudolysinimonas sp.]|uniref:hypothetical protein n=1 Tax=Pseudolysinimonas sp. TaxID=2680009 RepID=UPI003C7848E0